QRGWSQDQLARFSGLSIRTIQRIERGQQAGFESLKSLAAVFEVEFSQLQMEPDMNTHTDSKTDLNEQQAMEYVRDLKSFYTNLATYAVVISFLFILNYTTSPGYMWAWWPALGWGFGLL